MADDHDEFLRATMGSMDLVYNLSCRLTRDRQDAEDLVQETFLHAFRAWADQRHRNDLPEPRSVRIPEPGPSAGGGSAGGLDDRGSPER
jgi:hypothetical protein